MELLLKTKVTVDDFDYSA